MLSLCEFTCFLLQMQTQRRASANPQTMPADFGGESACRLLPSAITIYYNYSTQKWIRILPPHTG